MRGLNYSPSPAASSEREALLSRTTLSKTGRPQSGSYGSKLSDAGKVAAPPVRRNTIYGPDDSPVQYPSKSSSRPGSRVATPLLKKPAKQERKQKPAASAEDGTTLVSVDYILPAFVAGVPLIVWILSCRGFLFRHRKMPLDWPSRAVLLSCPSARTGCG